MRRIALLIDGANISAQQHVLRQAIDWKGLLAHFEAGGNLVRALYFTARLPAEKHDPIRPLTDWLTYNGFTVVSKLAKIQTDRTTGQEVIKGNTDVELAVCAMELAPRLDEAILLSGDGDFRSLVEAMQRAGVRVTVASSLTHCADELRRQADVFLNLANTNLPIFRPQHQMEAAQ